MTAGTGLDTYARILLDEIGEYAAASLTSVTLPPEGAERVVLCHGPGPTDPHAAVFGESLTQVGLIAEWRDWSSLDTVPAGDLVVDVQDPRIRTARRHGPSIASAVRALDLPQMGSIRHHVIDRTRDRLVDLIDAALTLSDPLSVRTALAIICDQLTGLPRRVFEVTRTQEPPYLMTGLFDHLPTDTVMDVGAADGDTLDAFAKLRHPPAAYLAYEFDPLFLARLHRRFRHVDTIPEIQIRPVAVTDTEGSSEFVVLPGTGASHRSISDHDATLTWASAKRTIIPTVTIDTECRQRTASLIKLDVEGSELAVLAGARSTLVRDRPVLAIAAYHEVADLCDLLCWLRGRLADYSYYLRKYEFGTLGDSGPIGRFFLETVLYAVPKERAIL